MKHSKKLTQLLLTLLVSIFISACSASKTQEQEISVTAISQESVKLSSAKADSYSWTQVSGESVILIDSDKQSMSFIAPNTDKKIILLFEVKMIVDSKVQTTRVKVIVKPLTKPKDSNETNTSTNTLISITLTISNNSLNLDSNTTLNAIATYEDNTTKDITDEVEWINTDSNAIQINKHNLKAKKETNIILKAKLNTVTSNAVALEIYKKINGHRLPPMPNKTLNDSTLLGIDTNNNGVRDDVERWIYETYTEPVEIGIFMQSSRAYNKVIEDPSNAHETVKYSDAVLACEFYWEYDAKKNNETYHLNEYRDLEQEIKGIQFNIINRHIAYERYNGEFNGEVLSAPKSSKDKCEFDENGILRDLI